MKRQIIKIAVNCKKANPVSIKADMLVVGVGAGAIAKQELVKALDDKLAGAISKLYKIGDFKAEKFSTATIYSDGKLSAKRVLLIGLGDKKDVDANTLRKAGSLAAKTAVANNCENIAVALHCDKLVDAGEAIAEGIHFGGYVYDEFVSSVKRCKKLTATLIACEQSTVVKLTKAVKAGNIVGAAQNIARTYANRPANFVYPAKLASEAKKIAAATAGLTCKIYSQKQLEQKGMGGILAVGQGSAKKPCMIVIKYQPRNAKKVSAAPVGLIGKAITFDSGGISLKPGAGMDKMKMDMTGGASVLAAIKAIAELKLPVPVYAVICAAENMPSSNSYRPGDIVTTYSGKTVEVLNTDAEGRIVLSDGIAFAKKDLKCKTIIDICTLTGACFAALGEHKAGLMGNDDKLISRVQGAAVKSGEPVWHLPSGDEYLEEMKSKVADLQNIGATRWGGACRAAAFLGAFADGTNWAHIDMAPKMEVSTPDKKLANAGSVGFGVRIFVELIKSL